VTEAIQAGNTVRLSCHFYDVDGVLTNPTLVKVIIYDYRYNKMEEFTLDSSYQISTGVYFYDFQTSIEERRYIYEWYGTIGGLPSIKRADFRTEFI
jgi:hypothetical protein